MAIAPTAPAFPGGYKSKQDIKQRKIAFTTVTVRKVYFLCSLTYRQLTAISFFPHYEGIVEVIFYPAV